MTFDAITIVLIIAFLAGILIVVLGLRAQRKPKAIERPRGEDGSPYVASKERPYMAPPAARRDGPQGNSVADEVAVATTDVAGEVLGVAVRPGSSGGAPADELQRLKGVGPKFVAKLNDLGITRFDQLAGLNSNEVAHLDERLGAFQGRLVRDRIVEQADYLARGDTDGFEEKFGSLGG
jgi:predicted flap endonuclease-1-like 5' DNA nuclease